MDGYRARARHIPGRMNQTETAYASRLEAQKRAGEIQEYRFEPLALRLARNTFYHPDFVVIDREGLIDFVDVKHCRKDASGRYRIHQEDDAAAKIKVAAALFPWFRFILAAPLPSRAGGGWRETEIVP